MAIKDWAASDRPREKLIRHGARCLTDSELLAIVIGSGNGSCNAVELSREILRLAGGLEPLSRLSYRRIIEYHGFGEARYAKLQAGLEIGRRTLFDRIEAPEQLISNSKIAAQIVKAELSSLTIETFGCVFVDTRHRVLAFEVLSEGTIDRAAVYPREVVRRVIDQNAAAVILCHNHPSGNPTPSEADKTLTSQLSEALALIDVKVLDHFVVAGEECISFADLGLI
ncbi:MAG: RadC family protein [Gammaproteobacteria bacterium]